MQARFVLKSIYWIVFMNRFAFLRNIQCTRFYLYIWCVFWWCSSCYSREYDMNVIWVRIDVPNLKVLNLSNTCCFAAFQGFLCVDHQLNSIRLFIDYYGRCSMFENIKYGSCCSIIIFVCCIIWFHLNIHDLNCHW